MTVTLLQNHPRFTRSEMNEMKSHDIAPKQKVDLSWFMDQVIAPLSTQDSLTGKISSMVCQVLLVDTMVSKSGLGISVIEDAPKSPPFKDIVITLDQQFMVNVQSEITHGRKHNALSLVSNAMSQAMWENFMRGLKQDPSATQDQIDSMASIAPSEMSNALSSIMPIAEEIRNIASVGSVKKPCDKTHLVGFSTDESSVTTPIQTPRSQPHNQALNKALTRAPSALRVVVPSPSLH